MSPLLLSAVIAAQSHIGGISGVSPDLSGTYEISRGEQSCRIVLLPPASQPSSSQLVVSTQSGLAAVNGLCALSVADSGLWRYWIDTEAATLDLVGHDGRVLWAGQSDGNGAWQGEDQDGQSLTLTRVGN